MEILRFSVGDTLQMKKKHPCGSFNFTVLRTGSDVRIVCEGCNRDITLPRITIEKNTKKVITK
jgi:hypothetical protein